MGKKHNKLLEDLKYEVNYLDAVIQINKEFPDTYQAKYAETGKEVDLPRESAENTNKYLGGTNKASEEKELKCKWYYPFIIWLSNILKLF